MAARRAGRKSQIPFGPFMLAGAFVAILWGGALADLYLDTARRLTSERSSGTVRTSDAPLLT